MIVFSAVFAMLMQFHYCSINAEITTNINILDVIFTGIIPQ